ncbi:(d)CMP kinase [Vibrio navarrensis]|uniref:(d)CMP kinase n=1 Tax=Vibrio navarrensis TaxID=29495 RepID=UPI0033901D85
MKSIITISGDIGSGKSSVATCLQKLTKFEVIGTGKIQRDIATEMGITTLELNHLSKSNRSIDDKIDSFVIELGKNKDNLIIDSRLAWNFIPDSFKVYLSVSDKVAADRVYSASRADEKNESLEKTKNNIIERRNLEIERFQSLYNVTLNNYSNYDLVIDTSIASPEEVASKIMELFNLSKRQVVGNKFWISPKSLFPTQSIRSFSQDRFNSVNESIKKSGFIPDNEVDIIKIDDFIYVWDGHMRTISSCQNNIDLIPAKFVDINIKKLDGQTIYKSTSLSDIYDWEDAAGFKFSYYPEK